MATSFFPNEIKLEEVMSAFNKDDSLDKENYRSISLLFETSKIYENYFSIKSITKYNLSDLRTGFWRGDSTQHCLIKML